MTSKRFDAFSQGAGVEAPSYTCTECGYESANRKNFRNSEEGQHVCTTGHYTDKAGTLKRAKNPYARGR